MDADGRFISFPICVYLRFVLSAKRREGGDVRCGRWTVEVRDESIRMDFVRGVCYASDLMYEMVLVDICRNRWSINENRFCQSGWRCH